MVYSVGVFDSHLDIIPIDDKQRVEGKIVASLLKSQHPAYVYPTACEPDVWFYGPSINTECEPIYSPEKNEKNTFLQLDRHPSERESAKTFRTLDPAQLGWLHVCGDALAKEVWDTASRSLPPQDQAKWKRFPAPPTYAHMSSTLTLNELDDYITNGKNLKHVGLYHVSNYDSSHATTMINTITLRMYTRWEEATGKDAEIMVCYTRKDDHTLPRKGSAFEKIFDNDITRVYINDPDEPRQMGFTHVTVKTSDKDVLHLDTVQSKIAFARRNEKKRLFVVANCHGFAPLTLLFRYKNAL